MSRSPYMRYMIERPSDPSETYAWVVLTGGHLPDEAVRLCDSATEAEEYIAQITDTPAGDIDWEEVYE
jgi:hypothetical protein